MAKQRTHGRVIRDRLQRRNSEVCPGHAGMVLGKPKLKFRHGRGIRSERKNFYHVSIKVRTSMKARAKNAGL